MNSPYRAHPASHPAAPATGKAIPFPVGQGRGQVAGNPPSSGEATARLVKLITLEGEIRQQPHAAALAFHAVNETRSLLGFRQGWFFRCKRGGGHVAEAVSDVPAVDLSAPLVLAMSRLMTAEAYGAGAKEIALGHLQDGRFPLPCGLVLPLVDAKGEAFATLLLARELPWQEAERTVAVRLAATYAHALRALTPPALLRSWSVPRWPIAGLALLAGLLSLVPVPMTALAPFEVVADQPLLVTAPMDGVIASVAADANQPVAAGAVLFTFDDTRLTAERQIAAQKAEVARSRLATARNGAFSDAALKRAVNTSEQELQLAEAEQAYAESLLARSVVRAERAGLLIYSSRNDWTGKPVRTGEAVMEIADPARVAYRIELPVSDAIAIDGQSTVRLFLDSEPLAPRRALVSETSFHAHPGPDGTLAYVIRAMPQEMAKPPRIGLRGTAQVAGEQVSLGFYLLRRPITAVRQFIGW